jgi:hypothetical protein
VAWSAPLPSEQAQSTAYSAARTTESEVFMRTASRLADERVKEFNGCEASEFLW